MDEEDLKRFIEYVERTRAERSGSKEKARQCLYEEGMIDKDGNLTPEYGGETVSVGHVERTRAERDAFARLIAHHTAPITKTKETARTALIGEGIYDQDGNLTPEYGGPGNSTPPKQRTSTHPGAILREDVLPELFAEKIGVGAEELKEILAERADVTPAIAEKLGAYLGNGAEIWLSLQENYNADVMRAEVRAQARRQAQ